MVSRANLGQAMIVLGIYAKKGFYEAYEALKILKQNLIPEEFAYDSLNECWDEDLVEKKVYNGPIECLKVVTDIRDNIKTGESNVTLSLLMCDIEVNLHYIKTILSAFC